MRSSHLALPGLGLAFAFKVNPVMGGAATLFLGTFLVWQLQKEDRSGHRSRHRRDLRGGFGDWRRDNAERRFGRVALRRIGQHFNLGFSVGDGSAVLFVIFSVFLLRDQLSLSIFSTDLAAATGVNTVRLDLYFLLLFSLTILVGLRFMGALPASALDHHAFGHRPADHQ